MITKSLFAFLALILAASAHGQAFLEANTFHLLREGRSFISIQIYDDGHVRARPKGQPVLTGKIRRQLFQPDGSYAGRITLVGKEGRPVMRGHFSVTRIERPFTPPGGPAGMTSLETLHQFQGRCSDPRILKPQRRHFNFLGSDFYYPDLY